MMLVKNSCGSNHAKDRSQPYNLLHCWLPYVGEADNRELIEGSFSANNDGISNCVTLLLTYLL